MLHEWFDANGLYFVLCFADQPVEAAAYRGTDEWSHHHSIQVPINSPHMQKCWIWHGLVTGCDCMSQIRGHNGSLQRPSTPKHGPPQGLLHASGIDFMQVFFNTLAGTVTHECPSQARRLFTNSEKKSWIILPIVFLCRMKESLRMYFNWVSLAAFVPQDSCWENGIFPIFIDPERGRRCPAALSLGRVGFHYSLAGNISSSRMLCLSEACFLFLVLTNTLASIRWAVSLPLLDGPHAASLSFSLSPTQSFIFLPLFFLPLSS